MARHLFKPDEMNELIDSLDVSSHFNDFLDDCDFTNDQLFKLRKVISISIGVGIRATVEKMMKSRRIHGHDISDIKDAERKAARAEANEERRKNKAFEAEQRQKNAAEQLVALLTTINGSKKWK